jgi:hypothetical protein
MIEESLPLSRFKPSTPVRDSENEQVDPTVALYSKALSSISGSADNALVLATARRRVSVKTGCFKKSFTMLFRMLLCG